MKVMRVESNPIQPQDSDLTRIHTHFPLLRTKLVIPPLHPQSVPRPHLIAELNKGLDFKLTLISAPTGFGKTTLLSAWASQCEQPVIWLSLSENDNEATQFWAYFLLALMSLSESIDSLFLEQIFLNHRQIDLSTITNIVTGFTQSFVLVLDNYHCIHNPAIHGALSSLLEFLPLHMHVYISSRTRPPLPLPRLRASRQLHEIRSSDLLFSFSEVESFLAGALEESLPLELVTTITDRTGGWVAILHLLVLWLQEQKERGKELDVIPVNHPYILEYISEEVLQQQSAEIQLFLFQTSILHQFNSALCNAVTAQDNSHLFLEKIERATLFLMSSSEQPGWYCYQSLFRDFLRERLKQFFPEQVALLQRRAGAWYEANKIAPMNMSLKPQRRPTSPLAGPLQDFSKREVDILQAIAVGLTNQEIAHKMTIAESTVKWYVKNIYSKLNVHNRAQAIVKIQNLT